MQLRKKGVNSKTQSAEPSAATGEASSSHTRGRAPKDQEEDPPKYDKRVETENVKRKERSKNGKSAAAFEMIVLGSGGGPLETDCSGYV
jgi:hypothetical protein